MERRREVLKIGPLPTEAEVLARSRRTSLYLCDNKEDLAKLLESDQRFGFIVMDGNGALFGTLSGNTRDIVQKFPVDLPKRHGRGGRSALRLIRLRDENRYSYVRKVAEHAVTNFVTADKVNVVRVRRKAATKVDSCADKLKGLKDRVKRLQVEIMRALSMWRTQKDFEREQSAAPAELLT